MEMIELEMSFNAFRLARISDEKSAEIRKTLMDL